MSQEQEDAAAGRIVRERSEARKKLTLLESEARHLGKTFVGLGKMLEHDAERLNISVESYEPQLNQKTLDDIKRLKAEILATQAELSNLNAQIRDLGLADLLKES